VNPGEIRKSCGILAIIGPRRKKMRQKHFQFLALILPVLVLACQREHPTKSPAIPSTSQADSPRQPTVESENPLIETQIPKRKVVVKQEGDHRLRLSPLVASLSDHLDLNLRDHVIGFQNADQTVKWNGKIFAPGKFRLVVRAICTGPTREARIEVSVGEKQRLQGLLALSKTENEIVETELGKVLMETPIETSISARMTGVPTVGKFELVEIELVPDELKSSDFPSFVEEEDLVE